MTCYLLTGQRCTFLKTQTVKWIRRWVSNPTTTAHAPSLHTAALPSLCFELLCHLHSNPQSWSKACIVLDDIGGDGRMTFCSFSSLHSIHQAGDGKWLIVRDVKTDRLISMISLTFYSPAVETWSDRFGLTCRHRETDPRQLLNISEGPNPKSSWHVLQACRVLVEVSTCRGLPAQHQN